MNGQLTLQSGFQSLKAGSWPLPLQSARTEISASGRKEQEQKAADLKKNFVLFFKGLMAWAIVVIMSYTFDMVSKPHRHRVSRYSALEGGAVEDIDIDIDIAGVANTSAAFALLMHTFGFSGKCPSYF